MARNSNIAITISTQRSGTKLLGNCFNKGTELLSLGEIFHDKSEGPHTFKNFAKNNPKFLTYYLEGRIFELLDEYFNELLYLKNGIHFDLMYSNLLFLSPLWIDNYDKIPIIDYFKSREICIFHLKRDIIDSYLSFLIANITLVFHNSRSQNTSSEDIGVNSPNYKPILEIENICIDEFISYHKNITRQISTVNSSFKNYKYYLDLQYENLIDSQGFITELNKSNIARVLDNNISVANIQVKPTDLIKSINSSDYSNIIDYLKNVNVK